MNPKRIIVLSSGLVLVLVGGAVFAQSAFAKTSSVPNLASEIAGKFNLNQSDVQGVIDQHRQELKAAHTDMMATKLDAAVASGKITSAQKAAILAEISTVQQRLATIRNISNTTDRKAAMKQLQADVKAWAQQNGLNGQWIRILGGGPMR